MRFRFTLRIKLVAIFSAIVAITAGSIVYSSTRLFSDDNEVRIQESNLEASRLVGMTIQNELERLAEKMRLLGGIMLQKTSNEERLRMEMPLISGDEEFLMQTVYTRQDSDIKEASIVVHPKLQELHGFSVEDIRKSQKDWIDITLFGKREKIIYTQVNEKNPILLIRLPFITDSGGNVTHTLLATVTAKRLLKSIKKDLLTMHYIVDDQGVLVAHPDPSLVLARKNLSSLKIVQELQSGVVSNAQTKFTDPETGIDYLGAYQKIGFGGLGVISQIEEARAYEASKRVTRVSLLITAFVGVSAFLVVFLFSLTLTKPIITLLGATNEVALGNYELSLEKNNNDEIGDLVDSFNEMIKGLADRERIKSAFNRFHSKEIAEKILAGEMKLGGERKDVVVFFSDLRGFTRMSESFSPEVTVQILNRYMSSMVAIIQNYGGTVDKYIGDAILAIWGSPVTHADDADRAVRACIDMRIELARLNSEFLHEGFPELRMGMGLNFGMVIAGNMGSEDRMEYTVIGDAVNTASRVEALTKVFGTDLLISEAVAKRLEKNQYILELTHNARVKGKAEPIPIYQVQGFYDENGQEVRVQTQYSIYTPDTSSSKTMTRASDYPEINGSTPMPIQGPIWLVEPDSIESETVIAAEPEPETVVAAETEPETVVAAETDSDSQPMSPLFVVQTNDESDELDEDSVSNFSEGTKTNLMPPTEPPPGFEKDLKPFGEAAPPMEPPPPSKTVDELHDEFDGNDDDTKSTEETKPKKAASPLQPMKVAELPKAQPIKSGSPPSTKKVS